MEIKKEMRTLIDGYISDFELKTGLKLVACPESFKVNMPITKLLKLTEKIFGFPLTSEKTEKQVNARYCFLKMATEMGFKWPEVHKVLPFWDRVAMVHALSYSKKNKQEEFAKLYDEYKSHIYLDDVS